MSHFEIFYSTLKMFILKLKIGCGFADFFENKLSLSFFLPLTVTALALFCLDSSGQLAPSPSPVHSQPTQAGVHSPSFLPLSLSLSLSSYRP